MILDTLAAVGAFVVLYAAVFVLMLACDAEDRRDAPCRQARPVPAYRAGDGRPSRSAMR